MYIASILPAYVTLVLVGVVAFKVAGGSLISLKAALRYNMAARYDVD